MIQKPKLTKAQLAEFLSFLKEFTGASDDDIAYLMHVNNQYRAYTDWKNNLPLVTPKAIITDRIIVKHRKNVPRGPGVKPAKKLVPVRLDPSQVEQLQALGGAISKHVRLAVDAYLKTSIQQTKGA